MSPKPSKALYKPRFFCDFNFSRKQPKSRDKNQHKNNPHDPRYFNHMHRALSPYKASCLHTILLSRQAAAEFSKKLAHHARIPAYGKHTHPINHKKKMILHLILGLFKSLAQCVQACLHFPWETAPPRISGNVAALSFAQKLLKHPH